MSERAFSPSDTLEDLEFLDSTGVGAREGARRTGFPTAEAMEKWLERQGRNDLWLRMKRRDPLGEHWSANQLKICSKCGESKPRRDFYRHPSTADRVSPHCKTCDGKRSRAATGAKLNRNRARHRAIADLIASHPDEFEQFLVVRLGQAQDEAEALAAEPAAVEHYGSAPVRLRPGKRMDGEKAGDRIDVARCPHCIKHHDRGHVCESCGAAPTDHRPTPAAVVAEVQDDRERRGTL